MLNSKELLEQTGISRATLNNYISWGIVPKPEVLPPEPGAGAAPRIGYFPEDTAARIEEIQRLKREGWSMTRIAEHFGGAAPAAAPVVEDEETQPATARMAAAPSMSAPMAPAGGSAVPRLSLQDIAHPAYLVDHRFDLAWFNAAAAASVLGVAANTAGGAVPPNLLGCLLRPGVDGASLEPLLRFVLAVAKREGVPAADLARTLPAESATLLERLHQEVQPQRPGLVAQSWLSAGVHQAPVSLYALQFREGILFVHVPDGVAADELATLLARRELTGSEAARKRVPVLSHVAVLVTDLQHSSRIWSELPPAEYFELINEIWITVDPIFRRHHGTHGKHFGDGMVGYFLPQRDSHYLWNAVAAAHEVREAMRRISKAWQLRKGWKTELYMNTGLDEGQQWLGTLKSAGQLEFTMLGGAFNRAARLSEFSAGGAIWASKNLIARLTDTERQRLTYGVSRRDTGREGFVPSIFATVESLSYPAFSDRLKEVARLPITEIVEIHPTVKRPGSSGDDHPI